MKKITIIFGGPVDMYMGFGLFNLIENYFKVKILSKSSQIFETKIDDVTLEFRFCFHPTRDELYKAAVKKHKERGWNKVIPLPADELVKKIKNTDFVLFFGLCGTFIGNLLVGYLIDIIGPKMTLFYSSFLLIPIILMTSFIKENYKKRKNTKN